jgi:hypothetical protein
MMKGQIVEVDVTRLVAFVKSPLLIPDALEGCRVVVGCHAKLVAKRASG